MIENNKAARISYLSRLTTIVLLVAVLLLAFTAGKNVAAEESDGGDDNDVIKVSLHRLDYLFKDKEGVFFIRLELDDPERTFEEIQLAGQLTLTSDDMPVVGQTFSYYSVSSMDWIDVQTDADGKVWLPSIDDSSIVLRYEEFLEDGYLDFQVFTQLLAGEYNIVAELFDVTEEPVKLSSWESTFSVGQSPLQIIGIENFNNLYGGLKQEVPITLKLDGDTELVNHKNDLYYVLALYGDYVGVASLDLLEEDDLIEIWNDNTDSWEELEVFDDIGAVIPADWDALASDDGETLKLRVRLSTGEYHVELYLAEMPDLDDPNTWVLVDYSHDDITVSPLSLTLHLTGSIKLLPTWKATSKLPCLLITMM